MWSGSPVFALRNAQPALLLEKVEEDNLAHQFLGKVHRVNTLACELVTDCLVLGREFFECGVDLTEQLRVFREELFGDCLDAERILNACKEWVSPGVSQQVEKTSLRCVAAFTLSDDVRKAASRRQPCLDANLPGLFRNRGVFHLDVGEPPCVLRRRYERNQCRVLFIPFLEVIGNEITDGGTRPFQLGFGGQVNDQHIQRFFTGRSVCPQPLIAVNMVFEGVLDVGGVPLLRL